jgi:Gas vesicle synthesis protein GvpL/GvpF
MRRLHVVVPGRGADDLNTWAAARAPELIARAEAEAVAVLRDALVTAAMGGITERVDTVAPIQVEDDPAPADPSAVPPASDLDPGPALASGPEPEPTHSGELLWVYCVVRAGDPHASGLPGVDGRGELERIESDGLAAVVSRVPQAEFGADPLRRNLNDLGWLERAARAHEAVLEATLGQSTLVPLRMCTLYESEQGVREMLAERHDPLAAALEWLDGRYEWAVKVIVDRERLEDAARRAVAPEDPGAATGRGEGGAYLLKRRSDRAVREAADALRVDIAESVHARLQDWAIDAVTRPPQNRELSGHEGDMALNGAYLVERERTNDLRALIAELEEHHHRFGVRIDLSGPWPPYNFVPAGE